MGPVPPKFPKLQIFRRNRATSINSIFLGPLNSRSFLSPALSQFRLCPDFRWLSRPFFYLVSSRAIDKNVLYVWPEAIVLLSSCPRDHRARVSRGYEARYEAKEESPRRVYATNRKLARWTVLWFRDPGYRLRLKTAAITFEKHFISSDRPARSIVATFSYRLWPRRSNSEQIALCFELSNFRMAYFGTGPFEDRRKSIKIQLHYSYTINIINEIKTLFIQ